MSLADISLTRVTSLEDVARMLEWLGNRREFLAVDTETTGLNRGKDWIRLIQFGDHTHGWAMDYRDWRGVVKKVFDEYDRPIVAHNLLYDSSMLKKDGVIIPQRLAHDTLIMAFLKNPMARMDLKGAATLYVDKRAAIGRGLLEQVFSGGGYNWATVPIDHPAYWMYGALDTCLTSLLAEKLWPEISASRREAYELELGTIHCLRDAELAGMMTDTDYIQRARAKLKSELDWLRPQIPCDPNSDKQVIDYLQGIGVPLFLRTEKGNLSTDKEVMKYFEKDFPVCGLISMYKSKARMLGSYIDKLMEVGTGHWEPKKNDWSGLAVNGVIRSSTHIVGAKTGRMSVTDPPLQTLPRGRLIRDAFVSRPGTRFCMADFQGMELRAFASCANETGMLKAFADGEDLHNYVATQLYGPGFTKQQRAIVKNGNFSKIYVAGLEKFATTAKVPVPVAKQFLEDYNQMFPRVDGYIHELINDIMEKAGGKRTGRGWVELPDGRVIPVPGDKAYKGVNYKVQGGCAVATKRKIVETNAAGLGDYLRLSVHDELIWEVPHAEVEEAQYVIADVMPDPNTFPGVTLTIDQDCVNRWGQHYRGPDYPKYVETEDPEWLMSAE